MQQAQQVYAEDVAIVVGHIFNRERQCIVGPPPASHFNDSEPAVYKGKLIVLGRRKTEPGTVAPQSEREQLLAYWHNTIAAAKRLRSRHDSEDDDEGSELAVPFLPAL